MTGISMSTRAIPLPTRLDRARRALAAFASAALLLAGVAGAPTSAHAGLLRAEHPKVRAGNEAYARGDYAEALRAYEDALQELPRRAELHYNMGAALLKLGRTDDAKKAFEAALAAGPGEALRARDYYNLGNTLAGMDQKKDAIAAYRQALKIDPNLEPARHNLELLLRAPPPPPPPPETSPDAGSPDAGSPDAGPPDAGPPDAGNPDAGPPDGGRGDGGDQGDGGMQDGGQNSPNPPEPADGGSDEDAGMPPEPQQAQAQPQPISRQQAEQLLDALRRNEKQFLMQQKQRSKPRAHPDKDW